MNTKNPGLPSWRILMVDDDPLVCDSIKWALSLSGHQVVTALTGQAAIDQFQTGTFDAVIHDYKLPDIDGDELASAIKSLGPDQPIMLVTAYPEVLVSFRKPLTGIDLVIPKPFSAAQLQQAITSIISKRQSPPPGAPPLPAP